MLGYWEDPVATAHAIDSPAGCTPATSRPWIGGLRHYRRPLEGHDHSRRRERLSAGNRRISLWPPTDSRRSGHRSPGREVRRRGDGLGHPQAGSNDAADELTDFCRGKIAHYKVPRYWRMTDQFPMTVSGKVQKYKLREWRCCKSQNRSVAVMEQ